MEPPIPKATTEGRHESPGHHECCQKKTPGQKPHPCACAHEDETGPSEGHICRRTTTERPGPQEGHRAGPQESNPSGSNESWQKEKTDLIETIQRLAADFDNYKKRVARDQQESSSQASADIIKDLLPVLDNFELCLNANNLPETERKGIEMIYANLLSTLEQRGVKVIDAINSPFDPRMHEALLSGEGPERNIVIEVLQKGYLLNNKVLRTAKVRVSR